MTSHLQFFACIFFSVMHGVVVHPSVQLHSMHLNNDNNNNTITYHCDSPSVTADLQSCLLSCSPVCCPAVLSVVLQSCLLALVVIFGSLGVHASIGSCYSIIIIIRLCIGSQLRRIPILLHMPLGRVCKHRKCMRCSKWPFHACLLIL